MLQKFKKLLVPIDFSGHSIRALRSAWELATETGAELHLLHVVVPHHTFIPLPLTHDAEKAREIAREAAMVEQAEEELARIKKDEMGNSPKVTTAAVVGPPAAKILAHAKENKIDLIVMATHGRTGAEHALIGSVTEKIVRLGPCAVLVVRHS
jgi:nucleotide-binding universal stress UspA family protein